jgi:predicted lactoylglutathione lyase
LIFFFTGYAQADVDADSVGSTFTGEILTLLYVTDVRKSVAFYKALGFEHDYYYDYQNEIYTRIWNQPYPPEYAEMIQGKIRVGLTTADEPAQVYGGGVRHYFIVLDVDSHYARAKKDGIVAEPDEVEERPWMNFFTVSDPDNHQIVIGEKNQAYYDKARNEIDRLERQ